MSEFFTQSELAERLVHKTGISLESAKKFSSCFFSIIKKGLKTNDRFFVYNFGTFKKTWIETTTGFNPGTGEKMEIPAHWRIKFIPCAALAKRLNRPYEKLKPKSIKEKASDNGLLAKASKIRSDDAGKYAYPPVAPADEEVKSQEGDGFVDDDFVDDVNDETERKGLLKFVVAAIASALLLIVLLALLLKSCVSSSKKRGNGKDKIVRPVDTVQVAEEKKEEPPVKDEIAEANEIHESDEADEIKNAQAEGAQKDASEIADAEAANEIEALYEESEETQSDGDGGDNSIETEKSGEIGDDDNESAEEKSKAIPKESAEKIAEQEKAEEKNARDLFEFYTVPSGLCYHRIAEKKLGNRHLWPLLYSANKSISVDPDLISVNAKIRIPDLEGKSALEYAQTDAGREAIFSAALDSYNGYLLMIEKEPNSSKNDERRRRAVGAIVSGEVLCPGFIQAKSARIMPEYARLAKNIVEHQYK